MKAGAKTAEKKATGLFQMQWVSVFGVYVPEAWHASVLLELDLRGYEASILGHTVRVRPDADDPERIERVREILRDYAKSAWRRPSPEERKYWLAQAEEHMLGMSR